LLVSGIATDTSADREVDPRLKEFARQKHTQTEELAAKLHLDVPAEAREFFKAAEAGDWIAVSNCFELIRPEPGTNGPLPGLNNVLYEPIHETYWAYNEFNEWDAALLQEFADGILRSIPPGSIYFGGTDPGRFVITAVRDVAKSPDIFIVTQNLLGVDSRYTEYLRLLYGNRMWVPSEKDVQQAFQRDTEDAKTLSGIMAVIDKLTKMIFENNKAQHEFYIEESYVIPWMFPYMEPHGLILKLNNEKLEKLEPDVIERDREFWEKLSKELLADPKFVANEGARKTYSKMRSAIGGLYAYRSLRDVAEAAFKQAITLCPASPEANFRLAQLYMEMGRADDAIALLQKLQKLDPNNDKIAMAIEQLRKMKHETEPPK